MSNKPSSLTLATLIRSGMCKTNSANVARPQPSMFYFPGLESKKVHHNHLFELTSILQSNHKVILDEFKSLKDINSDYNSERYY